MPPSHGEGSFCQHNVTAFEQRSDSAPGSREDSLVPRCQKTSHVGYGLMQAPANRRHTALVLAGLAALGPFSIDTYFPSFPAIAEHFRVTEIQVQSTLSWYLVALAAMNLFHGALSDSFGRRRVILVSLAVYSLSAIACAIVHDFSWLLAWRVIQGLAGGAGMIVGRALIRDCFDGAEAQKFMAEVTMVSGLGPALAPIVGGWLHVWFDWRGPFLFLALLGAALWIACFFWLQESLPLTRRQSFHPARLLQSYVSALRNPGFVLLCLSLGLGAGGFLLYVATAPDVAVNILGLKETQFGWLFLPIVTGLILGAAVSGKVAGRIPPARLVRYGFGFMALGGCLNLAANLWLNLRVPWAVLPLTFYTFGFALLAPVVTIQTLDLMPDRKGLASSLQGFVQIVIFAAVAGLVARLVYRSGVKHALWLLLLMALSWFIYVLCNRWLPQRKTP